MHAKQLRDLVREWIFPPAVWRAGRHVAERARLLTTNREEAALLARNAEFHDLYRGRRCFVIGNGPSIRRQDLSLLAGEITITMNWFNRHPVLDIWQPTFHCVAEAGTEACWLDPSFLGRILDRLQPRAYFLRIDALSHVRRSAFPDRDRIHYVKIGDWSTDLRSLDLTRPLLPPTDTSILATMVAIALGCSPIYLLGLDYDWLSHRSLNRHFYDAEDPAETREDLSKQSYLQSIEVAQRQWKTHETLRRIARRRGQEIYNATGGGFLDTYPPASLNTVLGSPSRSGNAAAGTAGMETGGDR